MEQELDKSTWARREIFDFFSCVSNPFYMITFRQDVTELVAYTKAHGISFYYALCYLVTKAMDAVPAFRMVIRGEQIFLLEERVPSFTDLKKGSELFYIVTLPVGDDLTDFCHRAREKSQAQQCFVSQDDEADNLLYISCTPSLELTALTNERDLSAPGAQDDSIPRIAWGKYVPDGDRLKLGISLEVNHRLIDGVHIDRFAAELSRLMEELPS